MFEQQYVLNKIISIHAPARGATLPFKRLVKDRVISIHAPARGATLWGFLKLVLSSFQSTPPRGGRQDDRMSGNPNQIFQSTPPRGGRPQHVAGRCNIQNISIHAPARGATGNCDL